MFKTILKHYKIFFFFGKKSVFSKKGNILHKILSLKQPLFHVKGFSGFFGGAPPIKNWGPPPCQADQKLFFKRISKFTNFNFWAGGGAPPILLQPRVPVST